MLRFFRGGKGPGQDQAKGAMKKIILKWPVTGSNGYFLVNFQIQHLLLSP